MLCPVRQVPPNTYDKVLCLLAACQKYDMVPVKSSIRAEVDRGVFQGQLKLTLDHPMTFETIGEGLRLFEGLALRELARFRKRRRDNVVACLESFLDVQTPGPSSIWVGCPNNMTIYPSLGALPNWLEEVLSRKKDDLKLHLITHPLAAPSSIREDYLMAVQAHADCYF